MPATSGAANDVPDDQRLSLGSRVAVGLNQWALLESAGRGWVATAGGRLLGFAIADLRSQSVWALFVDREAEGRGIGRRLHEVMVEWLFQCGARAITLGTDAGTRAERFYRTAGWQHIGPDARGEAQFEMTRALWISVREANGRAAALPALHTERCRSAGSRPSRACKARRGRGICCTVNLYNILRRLGMAAETTYSQARANLKSLLERVTNTLEPVIIKRRGAEDVALIAAGELRSLIETAHLLRSPRNAERLVKALERARTGKLKPASLTQLRRSVGLDEKAK
jgi:prevent-host-death family protein